MDSPYPMSEDTSMSSSYPISEHTATGAPNSPSEHTSSSSSYLTREEMLRLASRKLHNMFAATRETYIAALRQEIKNREEAQDNLDDARRQNYALSDLIAEYEELLPLLEARNREHEEEIRESRKEIRKGKQHADATDEYTRILEQHCQDLENASTQAVQGASRREKDLRMELNAENLRAQDLEQKLHLMDENSRQIFQWQMLQLRAEYDVNEALGQHTSESDQRLHRLGRSQEQSTHNADRIHKTSASLAHQGQYYLAGEPSARNAKPQTQRHSSNTTDSDISMVDCTDSADMMDVDDVVPPPGLRIQEILMEYYRKTDGLKHREKANRRLKRLGRERKNIPEPKVPVRQIHPLWVEYGDVAAECRTDSSDSESTHSVQSPSRKKRTRELDVDEVINQSPKRRRFSAEAPELQPGVKRLAIDETAVTSTSQTGPRRSFKAHIARWVPYKGAAGKKRRGPELPKIAPIRQSELPPPVSLLTAAAERQRLDARGRSLSLNDLPQLPSGQMPEMWPLDAPGDVVSQCQRAWRELLDWFLRLLWEQPSTFFVSVGVAALAWVWHCHRVHEDWMTANEIPHGIASELRNARVSEIRWVEHLVFNFNKWLDTDRSMLG